MVYKPNSNNSFRVTYNEATFGPSALEVYVDFPVQIQHGILDVWLSGQNTAQNFNSNAPIEIIGGGGATLPASTTQWPLAVPYAAVAGPTIAGLSAGLVQILILHRYCLWFKISLAPTCQQELRGQLKATMPLMAAQCRPQLEHHRPN